MLVQQQITYFHMTSENNRKLAQRAIVREKKQPYNGLLKPTALPAEGTSTWSYTMKNF